MDGNKLTVDSCQSPLVSVIMNCLNCQKYVKEAIDSVYAQTYFRWEIIFWDNASTDCSGEIACSYDSRLRYFRGEATVPLGAARNQALAQAQGEFIAFLDCDDVWLPEKLEKQMPLFNDPKVGIVFCDTLYFNDKGESERLYLRRNYYTGYCFRAMLKDYFLSMPSVVLRRRALDEQREWFDPRFNMHEDADLFSRIAYKWNLDMINEPLAKWRLHPNSQTWTKDHLIAEENQIMLAKFQDIFPDFAQRFSPEIQDLKITIAILWAKYFWRTSRSAMARRYLRPYVFSNKKAFAFFVMTYFPENLVNPIRNRLRAIKISPVHQPPDNLI